MRRVKFEAIAGMMEQRIRRGDYALGRLPSEAELAEETGVSRMTARKAIQALIERGLLSRPKFGRLEVAQRLQRTSPPQFAFMMPPVVSEDIQAWQWATENVVAADHGLLRTVVFSDWDDVLLSNAISGFDGAFLMQAGTVPSNEVIERLLHASCPVVSLDADLSSFGIPSIWQFPPGCVGILLDHLYELGHRDIACINTAPFNRVIQQRIDDWKSWCTQRGLQSKLISMPQEPGPVDAPAMTARRVVEEMLKAKYLTSTAAFCTSVWCAAGAIKAAKNLGLTVGRDLSVCTVNDEFLAPWMDPTITSLRMADPSAMLIRCVQWMKHGGAWRGSKLLIPKKIPLFIGDSTGPPA